MQAQSLDLQQIENSSNEELEELAYQALQLALESHDIAVVRYKIWLIHEESGFAFAPKLFQVMPLDDNKLRTGTTVDIFHPEIFPEPIFEYQYSFGEQNIFDSMVEGFNLWIDSDIGVLLASVEDEPSGFMSMTMDSKNQEKPIHRQIIFGNVLRFGGKDEAELDEEHSFCPCCLFTQNIEIFEPLLKSEENFAIRLFVSKNSNTSETNADCRVNGEEWEDAISKLKIYAEGWDSEDIEFRKQYVIIKTI